MSCKQKNLSDIFILILFFTRLALFTWCMYLCYSDVDVYTVYVFYAQDPNKNKLVQLLQQQNKEHGKTSSLLPPSVETYLSNRLVNGRVRKGQNVHATTKLVNRGVKIILI